LEMPMVSGPCTSHTGAGADALADASPQCSHSADLEASKLSSADHDVARPPQVEVKTLRPSLHFSPSYSSSHSLSSLSSLPCSPRRPRPTRHTPGIPPPASTSPGTPGTGECRTMSTRRNGRGVIYGRASPRRGGDKRTRRCTPTRSGRLREGWRRITSRSSATRWVEGSLYLTFCGGIHLSSRLLDLLAHGRRHLADRPDQCEYFNSRKQQQISQEAGFFGIGANYDKIRELRAQKSPSCEQLRSWGLMQAQGATF
jgi:hypothetical protein